MIQVIGLKTLYTANGLLGAPHICNIYKVIPDPGHIYLMLQSFLGSMLGLPIKTKAKQLRYNNSDETTKNLRNLLDDLCPYKARRVNRIQKNIAMCPVPTYD